MAKIIGVIVLFICIAVGLTLVSAVFGQMMWNSFCGCLHLKEMSYWQMFCFQMFIWMVVASCKTCVSYKG